MLLNTVVNQLPIPFTITGKVMPGEQVGRTIGFPTVNIDNVPDSIELKQGVYLATCAIYQGETLRWADKAGLAYFGQRHVFGEKHDVFEVYLYDFDSEIYDHVVKTTLLQFIREPQKLTSLAKLKSQLETDKLTGLRLLHPHANHSLPA